MKQKITHIFYILTLMLIVSTSHATTLSSLEGRLPATLGGTDFLAYYAPDLNITVTANTNINGATNWDSQTAWVNSLVLGGVNGWVLPSETELRSIFFDNSINFNTIGPLNNPVNGEYWTSTTPLPTTQPGHRSTFNFGGVDAHIRPIGSSLNAWAIHQGDVAVVPVPAAVWLFTSGLFGLFGFTYKKQVIPTE